jgi:hypothetical protein
VKNVSTALDEVTANIRALNALIAEVREGLTVRVGGIKAGIKTAINVLMNKGKEGRIL